MTWHDIIFQLTKDACAKGNSSEVAQHALQSLSSGGGKQININGRVHQTPTSSEKCTSLADHHHHHHHQQQQQHKSSVCEVLHEPPIGCMKTQPNSTSFMATALYSSIMRGGSRNGPSDVRCMHITEKAEACLYQWLAGSTMIRC